MFKPSLISFLTHQHIDLGFLIIKPIDIVYDLICVLSDAGLTSIMKRRLKQEESTGVEHVKRLDVEPKD